MHKALAALAALAMALAAAPVAGAQPLRVVSEGPASAQGASQFVLHSDRIGRDFQIVVSVPSATAFLPGQKFPAVYALDAGYGLAGPQGGLLGQTGAMAPAIIVSVGYRPNEGAFRNTDLLHNKLVQEGQSAIGGGGAAFEAFLVEDLKPFIEARYPADPARAVLFGHSFGGLFAANVFADNPDAFADYVIGSASVWADPGVVGRVAQAAAKAHGQRVFLAVGGFEDRTVIGGQSKMADGFKGLAAALKGWPGVALKTRIYDGETHLSYYPRLIDDGFPFVLPPTRPLATAQVRLSSEVMARYLGVYLLPDGRQINVTTGSNGQLFGQVTGIPQVPLLQFGPDRFYAPTSDLIATFDKTGVTMVGGGGTLRAERVRKP